MSPGHLARPRLAFGGVTAIHVILMILSQLPNNAEGKCELPQFLRRSHKGPRYWLTEVVYRDGTTDRESYMNITVTKTKIDARETYIGQCDTGRSNCKRTAGRYRMDCLQQHDGKYIINRTDTSSGTSVLKCYKFQQRNANVVQIWSSNVTDRGSCRDFSMVREEWPWIAHEQEEWDYCPARGGFNFRAYSPIHNEQVCPDAWTPNHMESECTLGEGFSITYSSRDCSPFENKNTSVRFICWAHWVEGDYLFVIAGQPGKSAQFSFRLDKRMDYDVMNLTASTTFESHMYFSPITPIRPNGLSIRRTRVQQLKLIMHRGDAGTCYDESEKCGQYAREGRCSAGHSMLQEYSSSCKRSCGMCNLQPNSKEECHFGEDVQGDWMWFENDRKENVYVSGGFIKFSRLGDFVCKSKHWHGTDYKLFSYYKNGCRPRYTCMRMLPLLDDKKIEFQLSKSDLNDKSFTLCENFEDDPPPIGGAVRSKMPKLLIPSKQTKSNTCGLNGSIRVTMTTKRGSHRKTCHGTVSDWNENRCGSDATLTVKLQGKCSAADPMSLLYEEEFLCDSYIALEDDYSLLITKSSTGRDRYSCWVIKTYPESMHYRPWKHVYLLDRAQCGRATDFDPVALRTSRLALDVSNENLNKPCLQKPRYIGQPAVIITNRDTDNVYNDGNPQPKLRLHLTGSGIRMTKSYFALLLSLTLYYVSRDVSAHAQHIS